MKIGLNFEECDTDQPLVISDKRVVKENGGGQCDCACSECLTVEFKESTIGNQRLLLSKDFWVDSLVGSYSVAIGSKYVPAILNKTALEISQSFSKSKYFADSVSEWSSAYEYSQVESTIEHLVEIGILEPEEQQDINLVENHSTLTAWFHVTDKCNLRCAYCYLPHDPEDMSIDTGIAAVDAAIRSASRRGYRKLRIKFAGGEPLIRLPFVLLVNDYARKESAAHGLDFESVILTNGTLLTSQKVKEIQNNHIKVMISLDGIGETHDRQRCYASGNPSFKDVVNGISVAKANQLIPDVSITVTGRNVGGLAEVVSWLIDHDLPFGINFYRENDFSASSTDLVLQETAVIEGMKAVFEVIKSKMPRYSLLSSLIDRANLSAPHIRTCTVGQSYLVFDQRGGVSKCQMDIHNSVSRVNVEDPLLAVQLDKNGIQNIPVHEKEQCRTCEWRYWCTGGCPLTTYRATGRYDIKSPNCNIYKALYPEALKLEGLRLLKYHLPVSR